ncbi:hypothetical protein FOA52_010496 [Chlamydomonas sp. UWO 241]|nr:hypothetical protein FOA52_010496 [Chlamydomonas sp. UWO 241]
MGLEDAAFLFARLRLMPTSQAFTNVLGACAPTSKSLIFHHHKSGALVPAPPSQLLMRAPLILCCTASNRRVCSPAHHHNNRGGHPCSSAAPPPTGASARLLTISSVFSDQSSLYCRYGGTTPEPAPLATSVARGTQVEAATLPPAAHITDGTIAAERRAADAAMMRLEAGYLSIMQAVQQLRLDFNMQAMQPATMQPGAAGGRAKRSYAAAASPAPKERDSPPAAPLAAPPRQCRWRSLAASQRDRRTFILHVTAVASAGSAMAVVHSVLQSLPGKQIQDRHRGRRVLNVHEHLLWRRLGVRDVHCHHRQGVYGMLYSFMGSYESTECSSTTNRSCTACVKLETCPSGSNTNSLTGQTACMCTEDYKVWDAGQAKCVCKTNYYGTTGFGNECNQCPTGSTAAAGAVATVGSCTCTATHSALVSDGGSNTCKCDAGYTGDATTGLANACTACGTDSFKTSPGSDACKSCASCSAGQYLKGTCSLHNNPTCETCPTGYTSAVGATSCDKCTTGYHATGTAGCEADCTSISCSVAGKTHCNSVSKTCEAGCGTGAGAAGVSCVATSYGPTCITVTLGSSNNNQCGCNNFEWHSLWLDGECSTKSAGLKCSNQECGCTQPIDCTTELNAACYTGATCNTAGKGTSSWTSFASLNTTCSYSVSGRRSLLTPQVTVTGKRNGAGKCVNCNADSDCPATGNKYCNAASNKCHAECPMNRELVNGTSSGAANFVCSTKTLPVCSAPSVSSTGSCTVTKNKQDADTPANRLCGNNGDSSTSTTAGKADKYWYCVRGANCPAAYTDSAYTATSTALTTRIPVCVNDPDHGQVIRE